MHEGLTPTLVPVGIVLRPFAPCLGGTLEEVAGEGETADSFERWASAATAAVAASDPHGVLPNSEPCPAGHSAEAQQASGLQGPVLALLGDCSHHAHEVTPELVSVASGAGGGWGSATDRTRNQGGDLPSVTAERHASRPVFDIFKPKSQRKVGVGHGFRAL